MRKVCLFLLLLFFPLSVFADSGAPTIVMDVDSGRILYSNQIHAKRLIASITKIMTCIIVLENMDLSSEITVGDEVLPMVGTNIYIEPGEKMKVLDLLYGLMLRSGNDAAETLAVHTFFSEEAFVQKMNEKAQSLGMKDTHFANPHGLDDETENFSTVYDMALLSRYAYQNETYRKIISTKKYRCSSSHKSYLWYNRVSLLNMYSNCVGGKNGYTPKAGKTLVSVAKENDLTLTIVSFHDSDIYRNHKNLYEKYFKEYKNYVIVEKKKFFIDTSLVSNRTFSIRNSFVYPLREEEVSQISTVVDLFSQPESTSDGMVKIYLQDNLIGEIPVYGREKKVEKSNGLFHWFHSLFS